MFPGEGAMKLYSAKVIADLLDLTEKRVRQLRDEGIIKESGRNFYELKSTVQAYIGYLRGLNSGSGKADYNAEKALLIKAKRQNEELDLQVKSNELHSADVVEQVVSDMLIRFKSRMMSIPSKLAPKLMTMSDPTEINELIRDSIYEALFELSDFKTAVSELEESGDEDREENG